MSKRFTETAKWEDPWFRELSPKHKALWQWLLDKCDCAGVLGEVDWKLATFQIGESVTQDDLAYLGDRVHQHGKRLFVPKFIKFQYGSELNEKNPAHKGVLKALHSANIDPTQPPPSQGPSKDLGRGLQALKDKDKDKEKYKDKNSAANDACFDLLGQEEQQESEGGRKRNPIFDALAEATEGPPKQITKATLKAVGAALAEIQGVCPDLTPAEIQRRAANYRAHFREAALTASALAKHWARCDSAPTPPTRKEDEIQWTN